ncbi:MAG: CocE/NonD family hydrolase [Beijerinckiaceae bacterium]
MTTKRVGDVDVLFRPAKSPADIGYAPLNPSTTVLPKGSVLRDGAMPLACDILLMQDVAVKLRDGVTIRVDIYRPVGDTKCPAIVGWSPYGKRGGILFMEVFGHPTRMDVPSNWEDGLNKFEALNPSYWVAHGYAIVSPDPRGVGHSEGDVLAWGPEDAQDQYDLIEWIAAQDWSNGKVGMSGTSWLAMAQWNSAAIRPPHLAAIAPWEGALDIYRDTANRGGIPDWIFAEGIFSRMFGNGRVEDLPGMTRTYPFINAYWKTKNAPVENISVPAYVVGSWTNILHTAGTFAGWRRIGSKDKWLRVHNTHEWTDYYNPAHVDDLRKFFDRYLKAIQNGWESTPRVRLTVLDPGNGDEVNRAEQEFPLTRQTLIPLYLSADDGKQVLQRDRFPTDATCLYDSADRAGTTFRITFEKDVEITGYIKLKLWVETPDSDDMDIFAFAKKIDRKGQEQQTQVVTGRGHVGANGRLRVSLRAIDAARSTPSEPFQTFDKVEKLKPGEVVPVEIGFWPYSMRWRAGETLELVITGVDQCVRPEFPQIPPIPTLNKGRHIVHCGGQYDSHLLLPVIGNL